MTALKGKDIKSFLNKRDPSIPVVLIYGEDSGAVRERSDSLAKQVIADLSDPFNFIELTDNELRGDPARLSDEAAALSFMGGARVIRIRSSNEAVTNACKLLIGAIDSDTLKPNALVLIEAGSLAKSSGLRKLIEKSKICVALPCYDETPADIRTLVQEMLSQEGLTIDDNAMATLVSGLGIDRALNRSEIEKLILYKGPKAIRLPTDDVLITQADVETCLAESGSDAMLAIAPLIAGGKPAELAHIMHMAEAAGASPLGWLRLTERLFLRLARAKMLMDSGLGSREAMMKLQPPVFYPETVQFEQWLKRWSAAAIETALRTLLDAELESKTTSAPQQQITERAALRLCVMGARR